MLKPFQKTTITTAQWNSLVGALFTQVNGARTESAELARSFFDSQWRAHKPATPRPDVDLPPYKEEWLRETLKPVSSKMMQADAPDSALTDIAQLAMKEAENGGRQTIMQAVEDSPGVVGWARVLTGLENCGFCVMLASRGPVYTSKEAAGQMKVFHKGCDCKIVPVHEPDNWPGRETYKEALELWKSATRGYRGKNALNALRRALAERDGTSGEASQT